MPEHDYRRATGRRTSDLDRVLDRLRASREQRRPLRVVARGKPVEGGGYGDDSLVLSDQEARVGEALSLLSNAPDNARFGCTDACHSDPRCEVDDVIAVDIDQDAAPSSLDEDRHGDAQTAGELSSALRLQLLRLRAWDAGGQDATLLWLEHVIPPCRWAVATLGRISARVFVRSAHEPATPVHSDQ
jgi:hypothetical protein